MEEMRILSTTAILGYGFPEASFQAGMAQKPHLIAADAGSTDPGPYYLGSGISFTDGGAVKRDLRLMITEGVNQGIPVIIGTAGGSGGRPHLDWTLQIVREIAEEEQLSFRLATISADFEKGFVQQAVEQGKIKPLEPAPPLTQEALDRTVRIVGQMGEGPFIKALEAGAQVVVAGRSYDPAVFAALPIKEGFDKGLAIHLGKILECAAIAATPGSGSDCMMGYLHQDNFEIEPLNPQRKCTLVSVAAHTLYEKTNPYLLPGPGGMLDLRETRFEQVSENRVRVSGSRFIPAEKYTIKLEGVKSQGYRTVAIAGARDPIFIQQIDEITAAVRERVADNFSKNQIQYSLDFIVYGRDGVMGAFEPERDVVPHEVGIVIEAVSDTQKNADTICSFARSTMLHFGYTGRKATAGNLAFPFSPSDFHAGQVFTFSLYHLLETDSPDSLFPIQVSEIKGGSEHEIPLK